MNLSDTDVSVFSTMPACRRSYLYIACLHAANETRDVSMHDIPNKALLTFKLNYRASAPTQIHN